MNKVKSISKSLTIGVSFIAFLGSFSLFASEALTQNLKDSVRQIIKTSTEQITDLSNLVKNNNGKISDIISYYVKEAGIKNSQIGNLISQITNSAGISNIEVVDIAGNVAKSLGLSNSQSQSIINLVTVDKGSESRKLSKAAPKNTGVSLSNANENNASRFLEKAKAKETALAVADEIEQKELLRRRRRVSEPR